MYRSTKSAPNSRAMILRNRLTGSKIVYSTPSVEVAPVPAFAFGIPSRVHVA